MRFKFLVLLVLGFALYSCDDSRIYDSTVKIKEGIWLEKDSLAFDFTVPEDIKGYNLFYNIRYNKDYPYHNLYIKHYLLDSAGKQISSNLMNMDIFDPKTGKPLGKGLGDSFDYSVLFIGNYDFPYKGKYTLISKHYMRDEPLKGIESFGLKIEKVKGTQ
jgi:gliding motility-associated lipoprotein GldH